ncbi:MAG: Rrf2 family transcriptional regulator [Dehalococcoidia bacterium]
MLQLNRKADYAMRLMLEVGGSDQRVVTTAEVARRQQIPYEFLRKVAQPLVSGGLLVSERGVHGGLALARPAEEISMLDIVSTFGAPSLNRCTHDPPRCDRRSKCAVFPVWAKAQNQVDQLLGGSRLSELVERQKKLSRNEQRREQGRERE